MTVASLYGAAALCWQYTVKTQLGPSVLQNHLTAFASSDILTSHGF